MTADGEGKTGTVRAGAISPFHGPSDPRGKGCLSSSRARESETKFRPECLSRSPILMAFNRFKPNGMANV